MLASPLGWRGDVSACTSENDSDDNSDKETTGWGSKQEGKQKHSYWPEGANSWGKVDAVCAIQHSAKSSTAGWDGDEDESDNTTS